MGDFTPDGLLFESNLKYGNGWYNIDIKMCFLSDLSAVLLSSCKGPYLISLSSLIYLYILIIIFFLLISYMI